MNRIERTSENSQTHAQPFQKVLTKRVTESPEDTRWRYDEEEAGRYVV